MKRFAFALLFALIPCAAFAQPDWGVYPDGGTLYFYTNTVGSDGVAETPASEAIAVYKDGSATQLTTGATIDDDFDSVVGYNQIAIDTTQSGFDAGSTYTVVYSAGTVDSVSIAGRVIGSFRLGVVPANVTQNAGTNITASSGRQEVNVTHLLGTAWLTPAVAGTPDVNTKKIGGTVVALDANGYLVTHDPGSFVNGTLTSAAGAVLTLASSIADATLAPAGSLIVLVDTSAGVVNYRTVVSATTSTITLDSAPSFTVASGDTYIVYFPKTANVTQWLGTAAATPTVAGVPEVDVTYANGSAITTTGAVDANVTQISGDSTAADNAELMFDGTGYAGGTAKLGVNVVNVAGTAQTAGDHTAMLTAIDDYVDTEVAAIKTKSDFLPSATAGATGGVFIAGTNAQTTITSGFGANSITATSLASGTIIASKIATDAIGADAIADNAIDALSISADAIGSAEVASSVGTELASAFLATDVDGETWSERLERLDANVSSASGFDSSQRAQILAALSIGEETGVPKAQTWVVKRIDGQLKATATVPKDAEETFDVLVDFRAVLASGDAIKPADEGGIVSIELIDDGAEGDQVESDAFDDVDNASVWMNAGIRFEVSGGTIGQTDRIRVKALTVDGKTLSVPCSIKVTDAGAP